MGMPIRVNYTMQRDGELGICIEKQGLIEIEIDLPRELETKTLIHELVHLYGSALGKDLPENMVLMIENIIWMMMKENKNILQRLYDFHINRKGNK